MGRQVFTAGEILTAASMNDLGDATVMVFDDATDRATAIPTPVEGMVTYLKDTDEVDKFDGSDFVPVGIAPAILQVLSTPKTNTFSTASTSYLDVTGLTVTITPQSATSKMMIFAQVAASSSTGEADNINFRISGGNSTTYVGDSASNRNRAVFGAFHSSGAYLYSVGVFSYSMNFLDSPATTSAITYSVQTFASQGTVQVNRSGIDSDDNRHTRGASSITVMEVAG